MSADLGHWTTPRRPTPCRFPGVGRDGQDPGEVRIPVVHAAAVAGPDGLPSSPPVRIGARVFRLHRITAADHLGPTEAEYREVER